MASTVWKGYISFGLMSFPVRLTSAARAETVHFHMLHKKDLSRVKEAWFCAEEDKQIDRSDIVIRMSMVLAVAGAIFFSSSSSTTT